MKRLLNMGKYAVSITAFALLLNSYVLAQGFTGSLTTSNNDLNKPVRLQVVKDGVVIRDTTISLGDDYTADFSTVGVDRLEYSLPGNEFLGLGNSISQNGTVYPFLNGSSQNIEYKVFDITGRNVAANTSFAKGKYFLQLLDKTNGKILGTKAFINYGNQLNVEFKAGKINSGRLGKLAEIGDSLKFFYEGSDMLLQPVNMMVNIPSNGYEYLPIELIRNFRPPSIEITNIPENPTIDTSYTILINAHNQDYDANITNINITHTGEELNYTFNGIDSLIINPHQKGNQNFEISATDNRGNQTNTNLELEIQADTYRILFTKLIDGLGLPRPDLDVSLLGDTIRTGEDGIIEFQFQTGYELSQTDSFDVNDNIPGNLQDETGPFLAYRIAINPELKNATDTIITIQTFTDKTMKDNPNYWDNYVWANQIDREFYLRALTRTIELGHQPFIYRYGSPEEGFRELLHYSPEHTNGSGDDFRWYTGVVFDSLNQAVNELSKDENGQGNTPYNYYDVSTTEDSILAITQGNTYDFSQSYSAGKYINVIVDNETGWPYIGSAGEYVAGISGGEDLFRKMFHELGRGLYYINLTPYDPEHPEYIPDVMRNGDVQPHDMVGYYFSMNADPRMFIWAKNIKSIVPNSIPYWPETSTITSSYPVATP